MTPTFINLTPHEISVINTNGTVHNHPPSGSVTTPSTLPDEQHNTYYFVHKAIRNAHPNRYDLIEAEPNIIVQN